MHATPKSGYDKTADMVYFPRMLDKIRLHQRGELRADFHENLGKGFDKRCVEFLRVDYADLRARVLEGGTDEQIFEWCCENGRRPDAGDLVVWNGFMTKIGWNDFASPGVEKRKKESGLSDRDDIVTMFEFFEVDEGRKA